MASLNKGNIGILPSGALGVSFFYHLTRKLKQNDGSVYLLERQGSKSAKALRANGKIDIDTSEGIKSLSTEEILKPDLLTCYQSGLLPEVVLICPNPDQLLDTITTIVELLVLVYEKGQISSPNESLPLFVLASNGIYFQRFRQIFIEKIEEATLFARLPDLWPEIIPQIVCRLLRGVTIQTGLRIGSGTKTIYRPGLRGRTQIAGGSAATRTRCATVFTERGAWFEEAANSSATRLEFDKALVNLAVNLLGQLLAIDSEGNFKTLTVGEILNSSNQSRIRELVDRVFRVGQMVKVYDLQEDMEVIFKQTMESAIEHATHIPSSLQWVDMNLQNGTLQPQMTPTESWLIEPLIRYAKASDLEDAANYFQNLKDELINKLTLASNRSNF
ncbi:hypothetical protein Riv7116_1491 [Rivularia sp. PCC 7116]|uniref:hypothetical protein n=1 Tax=Rivularia sp. PCC 7116 TaxID=373994 RepID=UPI00029ED84A|nr:hypothetical protein [Rivularia sp. PCC 7116]AFY54051.1 hypothetical protein Riv7116_1491 [Rivularia sp. PCC 7116]